MLTFDLPLNQIVTNTCGENCHKYLWWFGLVRIVWAIMSIQRNSLNPVPVLLGLEWPLLAFWLIMRQLYSVCVVSHKGLFAPDDCTKCMPCDSYTLSECCLILLSYILSRSAPRLLTGLVVRTAMIITTKGDNYHIGFDQCICMMGG